jgi:TetR/AcrR family transcriptional regulator of autoinduction and epiphytic fitness
MNEATAVLASVSAAPVTMARPDGRNRRAAETRRKIIDAAKAIIAETGTAPTVVGVAKRADVSVRSVFQHFGDVESLFVTVMDSIVEGIPCPRQQPGGRPLAERVDSLVDQFAGVFDRIVPLRLAAGQLGDEHPVLLERSNAARLELRELVLELFAPEFDALQEPAREELVSAIGAALSWDAWIVLRRRAGLSFDRAVAVWRRTLRALFEHTLGAGVRL